MGILFGNKSFIEFFLKLLAAMTVIFIISPLHECAHGLVAYKLGDRTAKDSGRLTLNPMAHFDLMGALGILFLGFGWATPVPVNPRNFKNPKAGMALTAIAGPISNFIAAFIGCLTFRILTIFSTSLNPTLFNVLSIFLFYYIRLNVGIGVFNLIPVPPLDGSRILAFFLSNEAMYKFYSYQLQLSLGLMILIAVGFLNEPLYAVQNFFLKGIMWLAFLPFGG